MSDNKLDISQIKSYWISEADEALTVAEHLFDKKDYSYALFFGHLAIEKILKSIYVKNKKEHAPPIHNLQRLARLAEVTIDEKMNETLILISSFNIEARHPDLKRSFRKKCTKEYTHQQMRVIRETFRWLKAMLK